MEFEAVIGLEVHAQLATDSKIFCSCSTQFLAEANSNLCPICAGHPGTLPQLNQKVAEFAAKAGLAFGCEIAPRSVFARKNYFYADLPKGYQISQFDRPLCQKGSLMIEVSGQEKIIGIQRIHVEEDAGKSVHSPGMTLVNLNRAGVPLIEIVSDPDIRTAQEASAYYKKLRSILIAIGVNNGNMQEGNLRCDANVSLRLRGTQPFGTRTEVKNINSFRFVEKAIEFEIHRQAEVLRRGEKVVQETRGFDSAKGVTFVLRSKEEAHDYRYFPEPDLFPLFVSSKQLEQWRQELPELPDAKKNRYIQTMELSSYEAQVIVSSLEVARFFDEVVAQGVRPRLAANWVMGELLRVMKDQLGRSEGSEDEEVSSVMIPISVAHFCELLGCIEQGELSNTLAKTVFEEVLSSGRSPKTIMNEKGLKQVSNQDEILKIIQQILDQNPKQLSDYRAGKDKLFGFFVGQTMKATGGMANPALVNELLMKKLKE